jgi:HEAT repeat protein
MGSAADTAIPRIIELLADRNERVRRAAARALAELRAAPAVSVPALVRALKDPDMLVRQGAASALGKYVDQAAVIVPHLVTALDDIQAGVRSAAVAALVIDTSGKRVRDIVRKLRDGDEGVRARAAETLGKLGPIGRSGEAALVEMLKTEQGTTLCSVAYALWKIGGSAGVAADTLGRVIENLEASVECRTFALLSIADMGESCGPNGLRAIKMALDDDDLLIRCRAADALLLVAKGISDLKERAVETLVAAVRKGDSKVRRVAIPILGTIENLSKEVQQLLGDMLKDKDAVVRCQAAKILWKVNYERERVKTVTIDALGAKEGFARKFAVDLLGEMKAEARSAVPALRKLLEDSSPAVRRATRVAIETIEGRGDGEKALSSGAAGPEKS